MKKRIKLHKAAKRMIAVMTIFSMTVTGVGMIESSAYNGVLSGDSILSGDGTLSGNSVISGNADLYGRGYGCDNKVLKRVDELKYSKVGRSRKVDKAKDFDDVIIETIDDVAEDAKKCVGDVKVYDARYKKITDYALMTNNYRQSTFNTGFLDEHKRKIKGSCSEVATTIISEYYNRKERCVIRKGDKKGYQDNWKPYFNNYIVVGMTIGIYDGDGTDSSKVHKLYTPFYNIYKKNMSGDCDSIMLDRTIKSYNSCAKPVVGSFEAPNGDRHSMAILGYYDVEVYYKKGSKNKLKTYRYYAVNDGHKTCYEGNYRVQYISDKYIEYIYKLD